MYADGATEDVERTAYRKAEKMYKLYYDQNSRKKKKPRPVDLSGVVDFKSILEKFNQTGETPSGVNVKRVEGFECPVFSVDDRPGFHFMPGALSVEEQCRWIRESLTSFPQPPNRTNHNALYGPIYDLFSAAEEGKVLVEEVLSLKAPQCSNDGHGQSWTMCDGTSISSKSSGVKTILASVLLQKLRWSTLGLQFNWSQVITQC